MLVQFKILIIAIFLFGCVFKSYSRSAGFDQRTISIHSLSLFNQRINSRLGTKSWRGDWIFRRDRLELIDVGLRSAKPDLLIVQEMMERSENSSESDIKILSAGVLSDYEWRKQEVAQYADTRESEYLAVALGLPLRFSDGLSEANRRVVEFYSMGKDGYMMLTSVDHEDQPLTVVNVQLPNQAEGVDWIPFVQERTLERLERLHHCPKRVVIAGYLPGDLVGRSFSNLLSALQLRDAAQGFCKIEAGCFTATPINDLFLATIGDESPMRVDRILVNRSSHVINSGRIMDNPGIQNHSVEMFGLSKLWPTQRFGWHSTLRFSRCRYDELL